MKDLRKVIDFNYLDQGRNYINNVPHSHKKGYEIIYVKSGDGFFVIDDRLLPIEPDALYLVNGTSLHCSAPADPDKYLRRKIVVDADFVDQALLSVGEKGLTDTLFKDGGFFCFPGFEYGKQIDETFSDMNNAIKSGKEYLSSNILYNLIKILLIANECKDKNKVVKDKEMAKLLSFIGDNFKSRLTLDEISDAVCISKYHLCHKFKKCTGMTVFEYIAEKRLSLAKELLLNTRMPISGICDEIGFSDFSYFSKIFKESTGYSPSEYRKK